MTVSPIHDNASLVMTGPIQIRNPEVVRDIRALADRLGVPLTEAVASAVRSRLEEETARRVASDVERRRTVENVLARIDALPKHGRALTDDDLYDAHGLPK